MKKENSKGKSRSNSLFPGNKPQIGNNQSKEVIKKLRKYKKSIEPDEYDEYYRY